VQNNFYFLKQLTDSLQQKLVGKALVECFSQNKNELILGFSSDTESFHIKAHLDPTFCCLYFPEDFQRARKNSIDLFEEIIKGKVLDVRQFTNERCFALIMNDNRKLLFKMHGNRSNIILYSPDDTIEHVFNSHLKKDFELDINALDRPIEQSKAAFLNEGGRLTAVYPTFGKVVKKYLHTNNYNKLSVEDQWELLSATVGKLENPTYYIISVGYQLFFSLLPFGDVIESYDKPIEAINSFFIKYVSTDALRREKSAIINELNKTVKQSSNYLKKAENKLNSLSGQSNYQQIADIIMANIYQIDAGATEVTLTDFYNDNQDIAIKLKKGVSPQKNAENYYRKAKNQTKEEQNLQESINSKRAILVEHQKHLEKLMLIEDLRELRKYIKDNGLEKQTQKQHEGPKPFNEITIEGFSVLIGKNAKSNDKMLQTHTYKEDMWLHAKDVSGSHVIIKHQSGRKFSKTVIERAAQIAAYNSKRKTDSLCPVIVTPRKFVRKRKGDPAGAVVVDKEEVILVEPKAAV